MIAWSSEVIKLIGVCNYGVFNRRGTGRKQGVRGQDNDFDQSEKIRLKFSVDAKWLPSTQFKVVLVVRAFAEWPGRRVDLSDTRRVIATKKRGFAADFLQVQQRGNRV